MRRSIGFKGKIKVNLSFLIFAILWSEIEENYASERKVVKFIKEKAPLQGLRYEHNMTMNGVTIITNIKVKITI